MPRPIIITLVAILAVVAGCRPRAASPTGRLADMLQSNAKLVGYLYSADQPSVAVDFQDGMLRWRTDPHGRAIAEGRAQVFTWPDRACIGFEQKNASAPARPPERYLFCEATERIEHRNHLPRSQDFSFDRGDVFLEYQPPEGTGYPQIYYAGEQK